MSVDSVSVVVVNLYGISVPLSLLNTIPSWVSGLGDISHVEVYECHTG